MVTVIVSLQGEISRKLEFSKINTVLAVAMPTGQAANQFFKRLLEEHPTRWWEGVTVHKDCLQLVYKIYEETLLISDYSCIAMMPLV